MFSLRSQKTSGPHVLIVFLLAANAITGLEWCRGYFLPAAQCSGNAVLGVMKPYLLMEPLTIELPAWRRSAQTFCFLWASLSWSSERESAGILWTFYNSFIFFVFYCFSKCSNTTLFKVYSPPPLRFSVSFFNIWDRRILTKSGGRRRKKISYRKSLWSCLQET